MIGSILLGVGCFALGAMVGALGWMVVLVHAIVNNTRGVRDRVKKSIADSEQADRMERMYEKTLAELKAKKGEV